MSIEPKMPKLHRARNFMFKTVAGQRGVVRLDVHLHFFFQAIGEEEAVDGFDVEIILMLGRLMRLGFDQDIALETDLVLMLDDHLQEAAKLCLFLFQVGVEQAVIAFTAAPQHIVLRRPDGWSPRCSGALVLRQSGTHLDRDWSMRRPYSAGG